MENKNIQWFALSRECDCGFETAENKCEPQQTHGVFLRTNQLSLSKT